ncbi:MAG: dimethyl sulfoxide reductase anchor subunit, partial [Pseudomonadota bacterium]
FVAQTRSDSTAETATGLGRFGTVTMLEPPHTQENFLLKEMGFQIARKHARRLRAIAVLLAFVTPLAATALTFLTGATAATALALLATAAAAVGVVVERWLFFAEARHVVTLYYGANSA